MRLPLFLIALSSATAASAEPAATGHRPKAAFTTERHFTSNALDSTLEIADWYTLLRASLADEWTGEQASAKLAAEFQATRHEEVEIEDDRALALAAEATTRLGEQFELRGTITYKAASDGDDLQIGGFVLGTRTLTQSFSAESQLGIDLGSGTTLVLALARAIDRPGLTEIVPLLINPIRLKPARDRLAASAALSRTLGTLTLGAAAAVEIARIEEIGWPPANPSFRQMTAKVEAAYRDSRGLAVAVAFGVQRIDSAYGFFEGSRPTYLASIAIPAFSTVEIAARATGAMDTADSDDPLASWVQRTEAEIAWKPTERIEFGAGIFAQKKENLLFENEETSFGFYAQTRWKVTKEISLMARADFADERATIIDTRQRTLDTYVGITASLE